MSTELTIDFDIEEDIEAELSEFVRLSCTGEFEQAELAFKECLSSHQNLFPVVAEYGDFLLRQEKFKDLLFFTKKWLDSGDFSALKENAILWLMASIAELQVPNRFAKDVGWVAQYNTLTPGDFFMISLDSSGDIEDHLQDLSLRYLSLHLAAVTRPKSLAEIIDTMKHSKLFNESLNELKRRLSALLLKGCFWEAQGVLGYLLSYSNWLEKKSLLSQYCQAVESEALSQNEIRMALHYLVSTMLQSRILKRDAYVTEQYRERFKIKFLHYEKPPIYLAVKHGRIDDLLLLLGTEITPEFQI
ncbi:MAG: hypothetical protein Q9195_005422 [Heterodermia aff. obscurata]